MQILKLIGRLIAWLGRACLVLVLVLIALYYMAYAFLVFKAGYYQHEIPFITLDQTRRALGDDAYPNRRNDDEFCANIDVLLPTVDAVLHLGTLPADFQFADRSKDLFTTVKAVIFDDNQGVLREYDVAEDVIKLASNTEYGSINPNYTSLRTIVQPWDLGLFKVRDLYSMEGVVLPNGQLEILRRTRLARRRLVVGLVTPKDRLFPFIDAINPPNVKIYCGAVAESKILPRAWEIPRLSYFNGRFWGAEPAPENLWNTSSQ